MPKAKKKPMPDYMPSDYEKEAYNWGVEEGIIISPLGKQGDNDNWYIGISNHWNHKKINKTPETFNRDEIWSKVYEYYIWYYERTQNKKKATQLNE